MCPLCGSWESFVPREGSIKEMINKCDYENHLAQVVNVFIFKTIFLFFTVDPCSPNPCRNGGTCTEDSNWPYFECRCPSGYIGFNCGIELGNKFYLWYYEVASFYKKDK